MLRVLDNVSCDLDSKVKVNVVSCKFTSVPAISYSAGA